MIDRQLLYEVLGGAELKRRRLFPQNITFATLVATVAAILVVISSTVAYVAGPDRGGSPAVLYFPLAASYVIGIGTLLVAVSLLVGDPEDSRLGPLFLRLAVADVIAVAAFSIATGIATEVTRSPDTATYGVFGGASFTFFAAMVMGYPLWIGFIGVALRWILVRLRRRTREGSQTPGRQANR